MATETRTCDVLVIGTGASGMAAAITAASRGLDVLMLEKEARIGGTTARSGGWLWIPGTSLATAQGIREPAGAAAAYLQHEAGWPAGGRLLHEPHRRAVRHAARVSRLPRRSARRPARRTFDGDASVRRS